MCRAFGVIAVSAAPAAADIYQMCRLPKGAVVLGGFFYADDLDTGVETLDMDVGWAANGAEAADPDGLGNFGVLTGDAVIGYKPEVGTLLPLAGVLLTAGSQAFTKETIIQVVANVVAATFAAGNMTVVVDYIVP
ncbi:hypothetical protein IH992_25660 [Candidatus Poribacteria bacterium]|nr:hypothetical protein [Candidatus Poribacteria bacterium]